MPRDRKRKRSKKENRKRKRSTEVEPSEVLSGQRTSSEDLFQGFGSCALFPAQRFWEPSLQFPLPPNVNIKQESAEVESDDSTETVIRGETNSLTEKLEKSHTFYQRIPHQNLVPSQISIKTEPLEGDNSSNPQTNADVIQNYVPFVSSLPDETKEQKLFKNSCSTSIPSDSSRHFQRNESNNSLSDANHSGNIIHKNIKIELVSDSLPTTAFKENESPVKLHTSPKPPNPLSDCQECKEQGNLTTVSSSCVQSPTNGLMRRNIKKEPLSPERNESGHHRVVASPGNGVNSSMCSSGDNKHPSPPKSVPNLKSSLCNSNRKFSTDCVQYLSLNVPFNLEDIKDCISKLSAKYLFGANLKDIPASSNSPENISSVSILTNLKKEKGVTPMSLSNNTLSKISENPEHVTKFSKACVNMPGIFETTTKDLNNIGVEISCSKSKQFNLEKNPMQSPKALNFSQNSPHLDDTSKYISGATSKHDKNVLNFEKSQVKFPNSIKSPEEVSNKFIDEKLTSMSSPSFSTVTLNENLKSAGSVRICRPPRSNESPNVNNDCHMVVSKDRSPFQVQAVGSPKRQASEGIDVRNLQEDNTYIENKKLKLAPSKYIYRKENPSLSETAHSKNTKSAGIENVNHRNSTDSNQPLVKKITIADYQNKRRKMRTRSSTFMEQNVEDITFTRSPLASCYSSSVLTPDRVRPSTSSIYNSSKRSVCQNQKSAGNSQNYAIHPDHRLRTNVPSVAESVISPVPQTVTARMMDPCSSHGLASNISGSSRLHSSQTITDARKLPSETEKKVIPAQDVSFRIIGWNATWIHKMEKERIPPICKQTGNVVQDSYENFTEYYDTYYGLHLISIWFGICESWKEQLMSFSAKFEAYEDKTFHYKNLCSATMWKRYIPTTQSIIHIRCTTAKCNEQRLLGFVCDVQSKPVSESEEDWKSVQVSFNTAKKLEASLKSTVYIRKLSSVRVAIEQLSSLESFAVSPMRDVMFNPQKHSRQVEIVDIPPTVTTSTELQVWVKKIIECSTTPYNRFTLVTQQVDVDTLTILSLVQGYFPKRSTVLVCLRDTKRCFEIAKYLGYGFVLALKESEISNIPEKYKEFTLRAKAAKLNGLSLENELEVLKTAKIILTVTSRIFLGDNENATLGQKLTVIIEQSNMCTELETALPLSYGPENVVLLGNPKTFLNLHRHLHLRDYHRTLFHRLYYGKRGEEYEEM